MPLETLQHWIDLYGYFGLYFALIFGIVGLPIPDESLLTLSGYFISTGRFHFVPAFLAAFLGSTSGITVSYWIGRAGGYRVVHKYGPKIHLTEERLHAVNQWFDRIGKWTLTIGYFIPGVRHFTALIAGASQLRYPLFALFAYSGGLIWSLTFISLGYYLGETWTATFHKGYWVPITIGAVVVLIIIGIIWRFKRKNVHPYDFF
jgi:membrane protein DedA with SNARE-associated domain